ncbi:MAG: hypothetical protein HY328_11195 [Chloroflexi bacterium]|nr:hypothetical protein [Chloroflexota bacterium]
MTTDPTEWNEAGQITTKNRREAIKARFIDPDDPLKLVIVCDMWDVVQSARGNVKVDWTRSHRRDVHAAVESAVKMVLCRRNIRGEQFRFLLHQLIKQAQASYEEWPLTA